MNQIDPEMFEARGFTAFGLKTVLKKLTKVLDANFRQHDTFVAAIDCKKKKQIELIS